jgi:hypothetical protein
MLVPVLERHIAGGEAKARCQHKKYDEPTHDQAQ